MDLNSDLGEGFGVWKLGDDAALLGVVTSANVACGFHAGDPRTMRQVCELAAAEGVAIGAQVSYRDLAGFGRDNGRLWRAALAMVSQIRSIFAWSNRAISVCAW